MQARSREREQEERARAWCVEETVGIGGKGGVMQPALIAQVGSFVVEVMQTRKLPSPGKPLL